MTNDNAEAGFWIEPVAKTRSPYGEKFGIPRQAGLASAAHGEIVMRPPYDDPSMLDGLEGFSHLWLTFGFHACVDQGWRPRVRPPRLGGNREVGVWASRSPFRPNFLGLSAVRLLEVVTAPEVILRIAGLDLLDGTPVYDIKPYIPYADAIVDADGGYAASRPPADRQVRFSARAEAGLGGVDDGQRVRRLIAEVLALDPRPAYRQGAEPGRVYGMNIAGCNVRWRIDERGAEVCEITPRPDA